MLRLAVAMFRTQALAGHLSRSSPPLVAAAGSSSGHVRNQSTAAGKPVTKAVIFDMGGVLIPSPGRLFKEYETRLQLPRGTFLKAIKYDGSNGAWGKLETAQVSWAEFCILFTEDCSKAAGRPVDLSEMFSLLQDTGSKNSFVHPEMIDAIQCVRAEGIKTALLTNNWLDPSGTHSNIPIDKDLFDVIVESCREHIRKPDPKIYSTTLDRLQVEPQEAVFLDDLGMNLKVAKDMGIRTIKVLQPQQATEDLSRELGFDVRAFAPGTIAVPERLQLPLNKVKSYLNWALKIHAKEDPVVRCYAHGQSNPTYFVKYGGKSMVLRKKPPGKLLPSAHAVEREYKVMKALRDQGIPLPKMLGLCEEDSLLGTPFYVMEYVEGRILKDSSLPGMTVEERQQIYQAMCQTLAKIHSVNIKEADLEGFGRQGGYMKRNFSRWTKQYEASQTKDIPAMNQLKEWLVQRLPSQERLDNLILHPTRPEVVAVLDWELSTLGDPLSDLATNCMGYFFPDNFPANVMPGMTDIQDKSLGLPSAEDYINQYCSSVGLDNIPNWEFYVVFNFYRLAAILQGVYKRFTIGDRVVSPEATASLGVPTVDSYLREYMAGMGWQELPPHWMMYVVFCFYRNAAISQGVYKRFLQGQASSPTAEAAGLLAETFAEAGWKIASESSLPPSPSPTSTVPSGGSKKPDTGKMSRKEEVFSSSMTNSQNYSTSQDRVIPGGLPLSITSLSPKAQDYYKRVKDFIQAEIIPVEHDFFQFMTDPANKWKVNPMLEVLKDKARAQGLWNLFLPKESDPEGKYSPGLTNVEYAFLCEEMGKYPLSSEVFNCSAPDTGNMEVLVRYGTPEQQKQWLVPLLEGKIRSCFGMTEPQVASSDATNIQSSIRRDGDSYVINGTKWWTSGAMDPRCKFCIFMGKTTTEGAIHRQQSMILVPMDAPGVKILRALTVLGYDDSPHGHAEVLFENVRVPASYLLFGEGRGFEIAQGRLGPGRIHHCMRLIGSAERSLQLMVDRAQNRVAFGKPLAAQSSIQQDIAKSRIEIEQCRLLVLKAAYMMDTVGNKVAAPEIAMIKVATPQMVQTVVDRAIQVGGSVGLKVHGGGGVSSDFPLAKIFKQARTVRIADGPDAVHLRTIAGITFKDYGYKKGARL